MYVSSNILYEILTQLISVIISTYSHCALHKFSLLISVLLFHHRYQLPHNYFSAYFEKSLISYKKDIISEHSIVLRVKDRSNIIEFNFDVHCLKSLNPYSAVAWLQIRPELCKRCLQANFCSCNITY